MRTVSPKEYRVEQVIPQAPLKKVWPLMMPAERLAIWEEARRVWTPNADVVIAHIEQGRDEADRALPPRVP
jgi:hypothetical protein